MGYIEFYEIFIVMEKLTAPFFGLMFLQRNNTVLDMRQGILNFPFFLMQLKTADHRYHNVLEPILNPAEITNPPNDRVLIRTNSLLYPVNGVTGILQSSDLLNEEGDITFCPALVTLNDSNILKPAHNFTNHPYKLKKGLHIVYFSVLTPEQINRSNRLTRHRPGIFHKMTKSRQPIMSAVSSKPRKPSELRKLLVPNFT